MNGFRMALSTIAACSFLQMGGAMAQTVYESTGGQGKVYSDRPMTGSKPVELRPLNVMEPTPVAPSTPKAAGPEESKSASPVPGYRKLSVVFPETGGSVASNTATFEVRVSIDPPLQIGKGHAFLLRLDGRTVGARYTSTEMMVPPEFFGDVIPAGAQRRGAGHDQWDVPGGTWDWSWAGVETGGGGGRVSGRRFGCRRCGP